jgi:hypothetical protein
MPGKRQLPEQLRPLFWDYAFSQLSLAKDRDLIIRRVLSNGSWDAVRWLRFWGVLYDLPARQVNQWVKTAQTGVWGKR